MELTLRRRLELGGDLTREMTTIAWLTLSRRPEAAEWNILLKQVKHSFAALTPVGAFAPRADLE